MMKGEKNNQMLTKNKNFVNMCAQKTMSRLQRTYQVNEAVYVWNSAPVNP